MSAPSFRDLFRWEWGHVARSPLLWTVLLVLALSFLWGAMSTASLHCAQAEAQARTLVAEAKHQASMAERRAAYRAVPTPEAPPVPYWQDPTSVSGFTLYWVFKHAMKPHLPLSALSAGVSDIAPGRIEIKSNTLLGFDDSYDFENPRGLAIGRFDLGFAIVYLLPIALILLFSLLVTFERDRGTLRLVAAQAVSSRLWLAVRIGAILAWSVPAVLLSVIVALLAGGANFASALPEIAATLLLVLAYCLFWAGMAFVLLSGLPGAATALGTLAAIWALLTIGLPLAATMMLAAFDPAPSSIRAVDIRRQTNDLVQADSDRLLRAAFAARDDLRPAQDRIGEIDYSARLSFLVPETERRLAPLHDASLDHAERQDRLSWAFGYLAPPLGVETALATLAGTDAARHRRFEAQARAYQLRIRSILYPLVQREIAEPTPRPVPETRGRFNLDRTDLLPDFVMADESPAQRVGSALPLAGWLAALGIVLALFGLWRSRSWPQDL
jgi:ABC-2 type transport system permease protein